MTGICEGRVVIVTGSGRGLGRAHALELAAQGAKVVVNDLGCELDGSGGGTGPAGEVVDEIRAAGGEAIANGDDVADFDGAARMVSAAIDAFGGLDVVVNNAGLRPRPHVRQRRGGRVGRGGAGAPEGPLRRRPPRRRTLARPGQGRPCGRRPHHQHQQRRGHPGLGGPGRLLGRQGRHRHPHAGAGCGARSVRRHRERPVPRGPHPHDGGRLHRDDGHTGRARRLRRHGTRERLAPRGLAGIDAVGPRHRPDVRGGGRQGRRGHWLAARADRRTRGLAGTRPSWAR